MTGSPPGAPRAPYRWSDLRGDLGADIDAYLRHAAPYQRGGIASARRRLSALLTPSVTACALHRVAHWLHRSGWKRLALCAAWFNFVWTRVSICPASRIGPGLYIAHPSTAIVIQGDAGRDLRLFAGAGVCAHPPAPLHAQPLRDTPVIGNDVALGYKALVRGPVTIGDGCRIGVNAVVERDLAPGCIALAARRRVGTETTA